MCVLVYKFGVNNKITIAEKLRGSIARNGFWSEN
jgi:hypothetical protein